MNRTPLLTAPAVVVALLLMAAPAAAGDLLSLSFRGNRADRLRVRWSTGRVPQRTPEQLVRSILRMQTDIRDELAARDGDLEAMRRHARHDFEREVVSRDMADQLDRLEDEIHFVIPDVISWMVGAEPTIGEVEWPDGEDGDTAVVNVRLHEPGVSFAGTDLTWEGTFTCRRVDRDWKLQNVDMPGVTMRPASPMPFARLLAIAQMDEPEVPDTAGLTVAETVAFIGGPFCILRDRVGQHAVDRQIFEALAAELGEVCTVDYLQRAAQVGAEELAADMDGPPLPQMTQPREVGADRVQIRLGPADTANSMRMTLQRGRDRRWRLVEAERYVETTTMQMNGAGMAQTQTADWQQVSNWYGLQP